MTLNRTDKARLRKEGFTDTEIEKYIAISPYLLDKGFTAYEIKKYATMKDPNTGLEQPPINLNDITWTKVIETRKYLVRSIIKAEGGELEREEIDAIFNSYYKMGKGRRVEDWIKREYRPPSRIKAFSKSAQDARRRIKAFTDQLIAEGHAEKPAYKKKRRPEYY